MLETESGLYERAPGAFELRRRIYNVLENSTATAFALEQTWTRVGVLIAEFKAKECWRDLEYGNFDEFMDELKVKFKRGRTQLYGYLSVAEVLLPTIGAEKLEQMGISKALELKRAVKKLEGKPLPTALLEAALDATKTTKELRGTIGQALNLTEEPAGTWFDLDGFFMDKEERAEFKDAFLTTEALLGIKRDVPDHIRRKTVILAWMREWYGTHATEFNGGVQPDNAAPVLLSRPTQVAVEVTQCPYSICESVCDCLPERQALQGESRQEFENDRFGTAGPLNA